MFFSAETVPQLISATKDLATLLSLLDLPTDIVVAAMTEENLSLLHSQILRLANSDDNSTKTFTSKKNTPVYALKLFQEKFNHHGIEHDSEIIHELLQTNLASSLKDSIIPNLDRENETDIIISALLAKTDIKMIIPEARNDFVNKWVEGLRKIINFDDNLKAILKHAAETPGLIFITNTEFVPDSPGTLGCFNEVSSNIFVAIDQRDTASSLSTLVHECTHKIIHNKYNNNSLPYSKDEQSSFQLIQDKIQEELNIEQEFYCKAYINKWHEANLPLGSDLTKETFDNDLSGYSWLYKIRKCYTKDKFDIELFSHFTQEITNKLLEHEVYKVGVSKSFIKDVWAYFHDQILALSPIEAELPPILQRLDIVTSDTERTALIEEAEMIVASGYPLLDWLYNDAGKLAYQSLASFDKLCFMDEAFESPIEALKPLLKDIATPLLTASDDQLKFQFTHKLLKLDPVKVKSLLEVQSSQFIKDSVITPLFSLKSELLQNSLKKNGKVLAEIAGTNKSLILDNLNTSGLSQEFFEIFTVAEMPNIDELHDVQASGNHIDAS